MRFWHLVKVNLIMIVRNKTGLFWTIVIPAATYIALSILPIGKILGNISYSAFLLPGIIALTIMQGGIYTFAYWSVDLQARGVARQLATTPIRESEFILSLISARSLIMLFQALFLTLIGVLVFGVQVHGSVLWIILFVILGGFVFLPIGLLISTVARNYDAAAPLTAGIGLPMTFLGSVFYPIQFLPGYLAIIGRYLPITFLADGLRKVYSGNPGLFDLYHDLLWLILWILVLFAITSWRYKLEE